LVVPGPRTPETPGKGSLNSKGRVENKLFVNYCQIGAKKRKV
jgi:hypothetical protein